MKSLHVNMPVVYVSSWADNKPPWFQCIQNICPLGMKQCSSKNRVLNAWKTQANVDLRFYFKPRPMILLHEVTWIGFARQRIGRGRLICHMRRKKGGQSVKSSSLILISEVSNINCFLCCKYIFSYTLWTHSFQSRLQLLIETILS